MKHVYFAVFTVMAVYIGWGTDWRFPVFLLWMCGAYMTYSPNPFKDLQS